MSKQPARTTPLDSFSPKRHRFLPAVRVREASQYRRVLNTKRRAVEGRLELFCYDAGLDQPRLGVIVAKKILKKAVDRNRFKRLVRESFRLLLPDLVAKDYVVRLRFRPTLDRSQFADIRQDADRLWMLFLKNNQSLR